MKKIVLIGLLLQFTVANDEAMRQLYLKNGCNACHGMYAEGIGAAPKLAGVREEVLMERLRNLQNGKTRSAFGTIMISFAKALDENQTKAMAKYLSGLKKHEPEERYEEDEFDVTS